MFQGKIQEDELKTRGILDWEVDLCVPSPLTAKTVAWGCWPQSMCCHIMSQPRPLEQPICETPAALKTPTTVWGHRLSTALYRSWLGERNFLQDSINTNTPLFTMHCLKIPRTVNPRILQLLKHEGIGTRSGAENSLALFRRQQQPIPLPCWGAATLHLHRAFHDAKGQDVAAENSR